MTNKKLLVLGGSSASLDVVKIAKKMGVYTIVTDDRPSGAAKDIADEAAMVSTIDMDGLLQLIRQKNIDGVFCGPSEFNIINTMKICSLAGLPFYATKEQWDICSNKDRFKQLCRDNAVPCVPEYTLTADFLEDDLKNIEYPVIVKPVDGCSSKGISVCRSAGELKTAFANALEYSQSGRVIVEKYVENGGVVTSVRYIACHGELYCSLLGDTYVVDPVNRTALISAVTVFPSKLTGSYLAGTDQKVKEMFKSIGFKNGALFMQSLPEDGWVYFHEMGLRLSGGLTYKITEAANGVNDLAMMIRFALGGEMCVENELKRIDPYLGGRLAVGFCVPLKIGAVASVAGVEEILRTLPIEDFIQYYAVGDCVTPEKIGTLMQHFGRFKFFAAGKEEIAAVIDTIQNTLKITDTDGNDMLYMRFDTNRLA